MDRASTSEKTTLNFEDEMKVFYHAILGSALFQRVVNKLVTAKCSTMTSSESYQ